MIYNSKHLFIDNKKPRQADEHTVLAMGHQLFCMPSRLHDKETSWVIYDIVPGSLVYGITV